MQINVNKEKMSARLKRILLWGGIEKDDYTRIEEDIAEKNRQYLVYFSVLSFLIFGILFICTYISNNVFYIRYRQMYLALTGISLVLIGAVYLLASKSKLMTTILANVFLVILLGAGIANTMTDLTHKSAIYMIFVATVSLLFTIKPINIIILEVIVEAIYLYLIYTYERGMDIYLINRGNSIIITLASLIIGTNVLYEKTKSVYYANHNQYLLETDVLTGLYNRRCFESNIQSVKDGKKLFGLASFDVNGLKSANDNIGHHAGDELIIGAGECISAVFGQYGKCFRTGGDEYTALLFKDADPDVIKSDFIKEMADWKGELNNSIHISYGLVMLADYPDMDIPEIIKTADSLMYKDKSDYYIRNNIDRRRR